MSPAHRIILIAVGVTSSVSAFASALREQRAGNAGRETIHVLIGAAFTALAAWGIVG